MLFVSGQLFSTTNYASESFMGHEKGEGALQRITRPVANPR